MPEPKLHLHLREQKGPWFVVNLTGRWNHASLTRSNKPTVLFWTIAEAFEELDKMARIKPGNDYALFECIGHALANQREKMDLPDRSKKPDVIYPQRERRFCIPRVKKEEPIEA